MAPGGAFVDCSLSGKFHRILKEEAMELKSNLIARQNHVIEAQKELIEAKNSQLQELLDSVVSRRLLEKQFRISSNLTVMLFKYMQQEMAVVTF